MDSGTPVAQRVVSERVLADLRVIAVDQDITREVIDPALINLNHAA